MSRAQPQFDSLLERIRAEAAARRGDPETAALPPPPSGGGDEPSFEEKSSYTLDDFMRFHGAALVRNAYVGLLLREPEGAILAHWANLLAAGRSRVDVLGRIRYSAEGRRVGRPVRGLPLAFARALAERVPVLSHLVALAGLPRLYRHHRALEAHATAQTAALHAAQRALHSQRNEFATQHEQALGQIREAAAQLRAEDLALRHALEAQFAQRDTHLAQTRSQFITALEEVEQRMSDTAADALITMRDSTADAIITMREQLVVAREELAAVVQQAADTLRSATDEFQRNVAHLQVELAASDNRTRGLARDLHVMKRGSEAVDPVTPARFDALYTAFEEAFRGPPEVIRRRLALYLPAIREAKAGVKGRLVLDLGSGRGEWLELLREQGLAARGVEINAITAQASRDEGLDVATADLFAHLKATDDASLGAVTSFHVIEHVPFEALVQLLAHARRALKPGGLLLLETPNPENTIVGACNFYADPTHIKPIPPDLLAFLVKNAGFGDVTIRRLWEDRIADPWAHEAPVKHANVQRAIDIVRTNFFAPPDYAVLAIRP